MIQIESDSKPLHQIPQPPKRTRRDDVGWSGITVSLAVHGILVILAIFVFYKWVTPAPEPKLDFLPGGGGGGNEGQTANKVQTQMRHAATMTPNRRIAAATESAFTIPETEDVVDANVPSMDSMLQSSGTGGGGGGGHDGGIGTGTGIGTGPGSGAGKSKGFVNPFGSTELVQGSMPGYFYDFKQTKEGKPVPGYNPAHYEDYTTKLEDVQRSGFRESSLKKFFRAPEPLYLTQVAIRTSNAAQGPAFFNVADKVQPAGWLVHYSGKIAAQRDITFRFVGSADDYLAAYVNGHARMIACWPGVRGLIVGRWEPKEPLDEHAPTPIENCPVTYGEWVKMRKGEQMSFDIGIGECPGGQVGFVLMVQEKDKEYRKAANGAPILPLFTTETIRPETKDRIIKDFPNWEFDWDNVPVFPVQGKVDDI